MKKSLLMLSLAVSAFVAPVATSAEVNSELVGKEMLVGEAVTEITPGKWYLLNNVTRGNYVKEETTAYKMRALPTSRSVSENAGYLFKITNSTTEGKYNIQSGNGLYFELGNNNSSVSQTARDFDIQKIGSTADRFYMQDVASQFIADGQQTGENFVGYGTSIPTTTGGNNVYRFIAVTIADRIFDVTYTFTTAGDQTFTRTIPVVVGENAADHIPTVDFFTATGLQEATTIVGENATTFTVTGTWDFPVSANKVYRVQIRPDSPAGYVAAKTDGTEILTNSTTGTELEKTGLWYFTSVGYDAEGHPIFTMHSLSNTTKGVTFQDNNDGNPSSLSDTPTQLTVVPTIGATDFALKFTLNGHDHFVNKRTADYGQATQRDCFSSWTTAEGAFAKDVGCVIRVSSLTEDDFSALSLIATEDEINGAKANPTPEVISALIDKYQTDPLAPAIVAAEEYEAFIGTGLGQYNNIAGDFATKLADAKALMNNTSATPEQKTAAAEAIAVSNLHINQPKAGRFYRFHYGNAYMSSTTYTKETYRDAEGNVEGSDDRFAIVTEANIDNLNNTTVFYYDGTRLVTYPEGLVLGNLDTVKDNKINGSMRGVIKGSSLDGNFVEFFGSSYVKGKYNIKVNDSRYMYHDARYIDSGTSSVDPVNDNRAGYQWEITEVEALPVPINTTKKHFSVCVPVDLNITADHAEAHTGVIQGSNFGLQAIEGTTLPANTPAVLEYKGGVANNCVYFEITGYPEASAAAETTSDLKNTGFYATPTKVEGQSYFTVDHESFVPHTTGNLPAFAAILKVSTEQAKGAYTIAEYDPEYVSITEIEGAGNNGKQVIYDLQGRRVQRASKGLYIINGVKTLVK